MWQSSTFTRGKKKKNQVPRLVRESWTEKLYFCVFMPLYGLASGRSVLLPTQMQHISVTLQKRKLHPSFPPMRSHHNFPINGPNSWGLSLPKTTPSRKSIWLWKSTYGLQLKGTQLKGIKHAAKGQKYGVEMKTVMQSNRLGHPKNVAKCWEGMYGWRIS